MSTLRILRQERTPLVALTALAFAVRLILITLGTALAPTGSIAGDGLASLCLTADVDPSTQGAHDPITCTCATSCPHGCAAGPCLAPAQIERLSANDPIGLNTPHHAQRAPQFPFGKSGPIRAPPVLRV
ncbi:hypothetical protein [Roseibium sp.]|uniref:hypothetical protein n=1 Tax=Roseibium sp. TaxID=1936156 RepID=UPI003D13E76D